MFILAYDNDKVIGYLYTFYLNKVKLPKKSQHFPLT